MGENKDFQSLKVTYSSNLFSSRESQRQSTDTPGGQGTAWHAGLNSPEFSVFKSSVQNGEPFSTSRRSASGFSIFLHVSPEQPRSTRATLQATICTGGLKQSHRIVSKSGNMECCPVNIGKHKLGS